MHKKVEKDAVPNKNRGDRNENRGDKPGGERGSFDRRSDNRDRKTDGTPSIVKKTIQMRRVATVRAGGTILKQSVLCAVGNDIDKVGIAHAKSAVSNAEASVKAGNRAKKKMFRVVFGANKSVPHDIENVKFGSSLISIKRAPEGHGLICGSKLRSIVAMAGYKNIVIKARGGCTFNQVQGLTKALKMCITHKMMRDVYPDFDMFHKNKDVIVAENSADSVAA